MQVPTCDGAIDPEGETAAVGQGGDGEGEDLVSGSKSIFECVDFGSVKTGQQAHKGSLLCYVAGLIHR